jgi:hypothetical protein
VRFLHHGLLARAVFIATLREGYQLDAIRRSVLTFNLCWQ